MSATTVILLGIAVLAPGLYSWLAGRRLLSFASDSSLPERLAAHNTAITWIWIASLVVVSYVTRLQGLWLALLSLVVIQIGGFPLRKVLLEERWSLIAYLLFQARFHAATSGIWILLALAPALIQAAGRAGLPVATGLIGVLSAWSLYYAPIFMRLLGAVLMKVDGRFDAVLSRTAIRHPQILRFSVHGGRLVNAWALPSAHPPGRVVFSDTLLEELDSDEQAAVFAHEVAHLEYYTPQRLRWLDLRTLALILIGTLGPLLFRSIPWAFWPIGLIFLLSVLAQRRTREEESDRRAVLLSGNAEAAIRALVKMNTLSRLPRRWSMSLERGATHPSLARRIQAIHAVGHLPAGAPAPLTIVPGEAGAVVLFEPGRVTRFEGVPLETPLDRAKISASAKAAETLAYSNLLELRIDFGMSGMPALVATSRTGRTWRIPLRGAHIGQVQAVLDAVDIQLAPLGQRRFLWLRYALSVALPLLALGMGVRPTTHVLAAVAGVARPGRAAAAGIAAVALGTGVAGLAGGLSGPSLHATVFAGLMVAAVMGGWLAFIDRGPVDDRADFLLPTGVQGGMCLWLWGILLFGTMGDIVEIVPDLVRDFPDIWLSPLALSAGLLTTRRSWLLGVGVILLGGSIWLASMLFR